MVYRLEVLIDDGDGGVAGVVDDVLTFAYGGFAGAVEDTGRGDATELDEDVDDEPPPAAQL